MPLTNIMVTNSLPINVSGRLRGKLKHISQSPSSDTQLSFQFAPTIVRNFTQTDILTLRPQLKC